MRTLVFVRTVSQVKAEFEKSHGSEEDVRRAILERLVEGISCDDDGKSVLSQPCGVRPSMAMDSHGAPQGVASALFPGRSGEDTLTSGFFPGS